MRNTMFAIAAIVVLAISANAFAGGELQARRYVAPKAEVEKTLGHKILWYVPNRFNDLIQVPKAFVGYGPGVGASVAATENAQASASDYEASGIVFYDGRFAESKVDVTEAGVKLGPMQAGTLSQRDPSEVSIGVHALVGAGAGVSLSNAADFAAGLILIDPQGDDK